MKSGYTRQFADVVYRTGVTMCRFGHVFDPVCFVPLHRDHHVVWDIHHRFLQYSTAPFLPGKMLHVINRRTSLCEKMGFSYISELENIFSLLPRSILSSPDYNYIRRQLTQVLQHPSLHGIIFQSNGAESINKRWLSLVDHAVVYKTIPITPPVIEQRSNMLGFVNKQHVHFLMFASRFYEKGMHIFLEVVRRMYVERPEYRFTLVTPKPLVCELPPNVSSLVLPRPTLEERRMLYTSHDYVVNLSLGDSLGVFLDALRFGTPMVGYPGQHGDTYCLPESSYMVPNPHFIYGSDFLEQYNMFEYEEFLRKKEMSGFFSHAKEQMVDVFLSLNDEDAYTKRTMSLSQFSMKFSPVQWYQNVQSFYHSIS